MSILDSALSIIADGARVIARAVGLKRGPKLERIPEPVRRLTPAERAAERAEADALQREFDRVQAAAFRELAQREQERKP